MNKKIWVKIVPWDKDKAVAGIEAGADALVVPEGCSSMAKELGLIKTVAPDGDIKLGDSVVEFEIKGKDDEKKALEVSRSKSLILRMRDWTVIPLENLIAQTEGLFVEVKDSSGAKTAIRILEKGVDGVVLDTDDAEEIKKAVKIVRETSEELPLEKISVRRVTPVGMGDRVCVDTCTAMKKGEGMLAGNAGNALFLVHSETLENPYVEARPFRVNAGAIHAYILLPGGRTKYLSELRSGEEVLIADFKGSTQTAVVGRVKIEKRPLIYAEGVSEAGTAVSLILQNAETVRLTAPDGGCLSVVDLKPKDEVMGLVTEGGRHFGIKIEETIREK